MPQSISLNSQNRYEIKIQGQPDDSWLGWFGEAAVHAETLADDTQVTTFSNVVMDQARLVGLIRRLHGLGIVVLSIQAYFDNAHMNSLTSGKWPQRTSSIGLFLGHFPEVR